MAKKDDGRMKLDIVYNTVNGEPQIGCRASGFYRGFHIERTAACPKVTFHLGRQSIQTIAEGQYREEMKAIDRMLQNVTEA